MIRRDPRQVPLRRFVSPDSLRWVRRNRAFTLGNVVLCRLADTELDARPTLLVHEGRHATQYAWCIGVLMLPLYFLAAGWSWLRTGDPASRNVFERLAGLDDGHP